MKYDPADELINTIKTFVTYSCTIVVTGAILFCVFYKCFEEYGYWGILIAILGIIACVVLCLFGLLMICISLAWRFVNSPEGKKMEMEAMEEYFNPQTEDSPRKYLSIEEIADAHSPMKYLPFKMEFDCGLFLMSLLPLTAIAFLLAFIFI